MRRALALGVAGLLVTLAVPALAADPSPTAARELGKKLTALEKRVTTQAARRGPRGRVGATGPAGAKGPVGVSGTPGAPGPPGIAATNEFTISGNLNTADLPIVSVSLTDTLAQPFFFRANAVFTNTAAQAATVTCRLKVPPISNTFDFAQAKLGPAGSQDTRTLSLISAWNIGAMFFATVRMECSATGVAAGSVTFIDADIVAVHLDSVTGDTNRPPL